MVKETSEGSFNDAEHSESQQFANKYLFTIVL